MPETGKRDWRAIAEAASNAADPAKLLHLAKQLEKALDDDHRSRHNKVSPQTVREEDSGKKAG